MQHAMQLRYQRPRLPTGNTASACLCIVLASAAAGCSFETSGTGKARTRGSSAFGSISEEPSVTDTSEAAQIAADRLRSLAQPASTGQAGTTAQPNAGHEPDEATATTTAGANAGDMGEAGKPAGSAGARGIPVVPPIDVPVTPAADAGARAFDESDAGDDSDAGAPPLAGAGATAPPLMAAGAGGANASGAGGASGAAATD